MNKHNVPWEGLTKQGLFKEVTFTGEMRQSVLNGLDRRRWLRPRAAGILASAALVGAAAALLLLLFAPGLPGSWTEPVRQAFGLPVAADRGESLPDEGLVPAAELPVRFERLEARIHQPGESIMASDPDILPGLSNKYSPLLQRALPEEKPLSGIEVLEQQHVEGFGTVMRYTLRDDEKLKPGTDEKFDHMGFIVDGVSTPGTYMDPQFLGMVYSNEYTVGQYAMTSLFGYDMLKLEMDVCRVDGEACVYYFKINDDGIPVTYANFAAMTHERDLDGDGIAEAIVTTVKGNQIYIFKEEQGELLWYSLREALGAEQGDKLAYHPPDGSFAFTPAGGRTILTYRFEDGGEKLARLQ